MRCGTLPWTLWLHFQQMDSRNRVDQKTHNQVAEHARSPLKGSLAHHILLGGVLAAQAAPGSVMAGSGNLLLGCPCRAFQRPRAGTSPHALPHHHSHPWDLYSQLCWVLQQSKHRNQHLMCNIASISPGLRTGGRQYHLSSSNSSRPWHSGR